MLMSRQHRAKRGEPDPLSKDECTVLAVFIDFAKEGDDALAKYVAHCGITVDDIDRAGDNLKAILGHYRRLDGSYDIDAVAHDLARWPPVAARIKELKRHRGRSTPKSRNP
jgi:hypothetical protein